MSDQDSQLDRMPKKGLTVFLWIAIWIAIVAAVYPFVDANPISAALVVLFWAFIGYYTLWPDGRKKSR